MIASIRTHLVTSGKWTYYKKKCKRIYGLKLDLVTLSKQENINETHIKQHINDQACELFASKDRLYSAELMRYVEKQLF